MGTAGCRGSITEVTRPEELFAYFNISECSSHLGFSNISMQQKQVTILIPLGLPGIGKTTFKQEMLKDFFA